MRLGVSGKVLLAFTVLLLAFGANATFTVITIHRARQGVVANEAYLDLQGSVDAAWKSLNDFAASLGRNLRLDPNLALAFRMARKHLDDAVGAIDRYLEKEPASFRRPDFEAKRNQLLALKQQVDALAGELGAAEVASDPKARPEFESHFAILTHSLNRMRRPLRGENGQIAQRLSDDEEAALQVALGLGLAGLILAVASILFIYRTLRPLRVLRARVREVAGGDYARRTGVASHDEIGDLAREFDAMAGALQEREQQLIRSERLATVGRMAAQITHEVRNPLASIGLYAELLGDEIGGSSGESRRLLASISSEVDRLTEITETYLRFARLPRAKLDREDLGAIVTAVMEFARAELTQAGIALEIDVGRALPEILADESQLRQALLNLVRNAREALEGQGGGRLRVVVDATPVTANGSEPDDARDATVRLSVEDSGPGIPRENLGKIFDPFFSTKAKGTGLGLALVQQIVLEHGARIDVISDAGSGTRFVITFPRPAAAPDPRRSAMPSVDATAAHPAAGTALANGGVVGGRARSVS
ncbi:MAG: two-component system, NtrC family, sensor kinase [Myxococcales bacterium]|jgi:signal transduction histidine kinase/cell division protein FtsL|nr:two-component system, NtrC family, sensor kinase [Myxococcales bacterium]